MTFITEITGIEHFSKLMNWTHEETMNNFFEVSGKEFKELLVDRKPYRRDWWSDCIIYMDQRLHHKRVYGIVMGRHKKYLKYYLSIEEYDV